MDSYLYFCTECSKLFKVAETGRKVKCSHCSGLLVDLEITDMEYAALNPEKREALKNKARESVQPPEKEDITQQIEKEDIPKPPEKEDTADQNREEENNTGIFDINSLIYGRSSGTDTGTVTDTDTAADTETDTETETEAETDTETELNTGTEAEAEAGADSEDETDAEPETEEEAIVNDEAKAGAETEISSAAEAETDTRTDLEAETGSSIDIDINSELGIDIGDSFKDPYASDDSVLNSINETKEQLDRELSRQTDDVVAVKNNYLKIQIQNQILTVDNFLSICKLSALKDDGVVDKDEEKLLKKLEKASNEYKKVLSKMI